MATSGAKRKTNNRLLPRYLYRDSLGYYSYRDRYIGKTVGLGKNEEKAIAYALEENSKRRHPSVAMSDSPESLAITIKNRDQIILSSFGFTLVSGVYFLILNEEIVYVGQSEDCFGRLSQHARDRGKPFDSAHIIDATKDELDSLEGYYIRLFKPIYNAKVTGGSRPVRLRDVKMM